MEALLGGLSAGHVQGVASAARRASGFLALLDSVAAAGGAVARRETLRLLSCSGLGAVSFLASDAPATFAIPAQTYHVMVCRVMGLRPAGSGTLLGCPRCSLTMSAVAAYMRVDVPGVGASAAAVPPPVDAPLLGVPAPLARVPQDLLLDHAARCPRGNVVSAQHTAVVRVLHEFCVEAGAAPSDVVLEARAPGGASSSRPGDLCWRFFHANRHLYVDVTIAGVFLSGSPWQTPGGAAAAAEARKRGRPAAAELLAGGHEFVPFAVEECGRLGACAHRLLRELARRAAGRRSPGGDGSAGEVSAVLAGWFARLSTCVHSRLAWAVRLALDGRVMG